MSYHGRMRGSAGLVALAVLAALAACGGAPEGPDAACEPSILYLNRAGGMYDTAFADDSSRNLSTLLDGPRTLPPYPHDDIDWASLVDCIRTGLAPFPVMITETDPGDATHVELVFTTSYWGGSPGTSVVVPGSCQAGRNEVGFVFGSALPSYARGCHVAVRGYAQMVARLSIADDCTDFLNDDMDCSAMRWFNDRDTTCVDAANQPIDCRCGGGMTQNSYNGMRSAIRTCP